MNLLGGREFIGACASESEGLQQPIKVGQASDVDRRSTEGHRRANGRIKHPGSKHNRHTRFRLNDCDISSRSPLGVEPPDIAAMQRMPAVMDLYILVDMGRMAPRLLSDETMSGRGLCSVHAGGGPYDPVPPALSCSGAMDIIQRLWRKPIS
jgi:hypothetical protein